MPKTRAETTTYNRDIGYNMRISYDVSKRTQYVGLCSPGRLTSDTRWQIYRLSYDVTSGGVATRYYANNTDGFEFAWDSKTNYTYE